MKIYINVLLLTLGVILHIHVSSSMSGYPNAQAIESHLNTREPPRAPTRLPLLDPSENHPMPKPCFHASTHELASFFYGAGWYLIQYTRTKNAEITDIPENSYLFRVGNDRATGKFNRGAFYEAYGHHTFYGTDAWIVTPGANDFVTERKKPVGYFSGPHSFHMFLFAD